MSLACTCWDIGRFCNCYCGAYDEWVRDQRCDDIRRSSRRQARWAFGIPAPTPRCPICDEETRVREDELFDGYCPECGFVLGLEELVA